MFLSIVADRVFGAAEGLATRIADLGDNLIHAQGLSGRAESAGPSRDARNVKLPSRPLGGSIDEKGHQTLSATQPSPFVKLDAFLTRFPPTMSLSL
jgi:hypothetical protein